MVKVVQSKTAEDRISWNQAVSLSVDNTISMIGVHNSFALCCKAENPQNYFLECPTFGASNATDAFRGGRNQCWGLTNWFVLLVEQEYQKERDTCWIHWVLWPREYVKILKHLSTRWLSFEQCVEHTIKKCAGLRSYLLSESFADARFQRLWNASGNPVTEVVLCFSSCNHPFFHKLQQVIAVRWTMHSHCPWLCN